MGSPPRSASKKGQLKARSISSSIVHRITLGKATTIITANTSMAHANIGILSRVIPGARVRSTPTMISIAPAMAEISMKPMPSNQKSVLIPGLKAMLVSGGYMNQPPSGANPTNSERKNIVPPTK